MSVNLPAVWEMLGLKSCRGKLIIAYLKFGVTSMFSRLLRVFYHPFPKDFFYLIKSF